MQCFSDPALQQQLGAAGAGGLSVPADAAVVFHLTFHVPGKSASWQGELGQRGTLAATGRTLDSGRLIAAAVVLAVLVVGLAVIVVRRRRARSRSR